MPKPIVITKEVDKATYFNTYQIKFKNVETIEDVLIVHDVSKLKMESFTSSTEIPSFTFSVDYPLIVTDYDFKTDQDFNAEYHTSLSRRSSSITFLFYYWKDYGTATIIIKNLETKAIIEQMVNINCIPSDHKG